MSYSFYKVIHFIGIAMLLSSMGAMIFHSMNSGSLKFPGRRWLMVTHGLGMLVTLVAGFGLLARLSIHTPWPTWIWLKLGIWIVLGAGVAAILRQPRFAKLYWILLVAIVGAAAYLVQTKPI